MKFLDMFIIVIIIAVGMFGLIYMSGNSVAPSNVTDTFGNTSANAAVNNSYGLVQNVTAIETQGSSAGIIIVAACAVLLLIFAFIMVASGAYSRNKYRT
jgi:ABC-type maltose transport system permease subunit